MTSLTNHHSPNFVIPTEKPLGFDEESTVYTSQLSGTLSTHRRSSRRFAPQDDGFNGFKTPLRMTSLGDCYSII